MRIRREGLSYWVLLALETAARDKVLEVFSYSAQMKYMISLPHLTHNTKRSAIAEAIRRLRRKGFLEHEKDSENRTFLRLTELGKDELGIEGEWDGRYRIVIWDVPETKRRLRNLLRRKLKEWDFKELQKSVWVSKRNATVKLRRLLLDLEMEKWVVVIESDDSSLSHINFHDRGSK